MIKVDISNVWGELSLPDLLATEKEIFDAHMTLTDGSGEGNDFLGWLNLPVTEETDEIRRIRAAAKRIRETSDVFVVIGIGGSYLGPRACHRHPRAALAVGAQVRHRRRKGAYLRYHRPGQGRSAPDG